MDKINTEFFKLSKMCRRWWSTAEKTKILSVVVIVVVGVAITVPCVFFLFCSTDAVFPHGLSNCSEDADMNQYATQLDDGYVKLTCDTDRLRTNVMYNLTGARLNMAIRQTDQL